MKVLSLFDGISCGMVALERANITIDKYVAYEIDKYAIQVSKKNYPMIEHKGDVFNADFTEYKGYDLLLGGSPCTFWSIANDSREITPNGRGGQLFMQYVRALKESECKWFLYENNFSIHQNIKDFISEQLGVQPIMINSSLLSAQNRKRCYWTNIPEIIQPQDKGIMLNDILDGAISYTPKAYCLTATYRNVGRSVKEIFHNIEKHKRTMVFIPVDNQQINGNIYSLKRGNLSLQDQTETCEVKIDLSDGNYLIRKLTPIETERLQTLPDNYTDCISNTQRYQCIGNGWTVDVITHILSFLKPLITNGKET